MKKEHWLVFVVIVLAVAGFYFDEIMMSPIQVDSIKSRTMSLGNVDILPEPTIMPIDERVRTEGRGQLQNCYLAPDGLTSTGMVCSCDCETGRPPAGEPGPIQGCVVRKIYNYPPGVNPSNPSADCGNIFNGKSCACSNLQTE